MGIHLHIFQYGIYLTLVLLYDIIEKFIDKDLLFSHIL